MQFVPHGAAVTAAATREYAAASAVAASAAREYAGSGRAGTLPKCTCFLGRTRMRAQILLLPWAEPAVNASRPATSGVGLSSL